MQKITISQGTVLNNRLIKKEDRPISWNVAFVEIDQNTPKSKIILEKLDKLRLI